MPPAPDSPAGASPAALEAAGPPPVFEDYSPPRAAPEPIGSPPAPDSPAPPDVAPSAEDEGAWAPWQPSAAPRAPFEPSREPLPRDVEGMFLRRAEEALVAGRCAHYENGLAELVETSESPQAREKARIIRARCFDATLRPAEAEREYRRYLRDWPGGRWADEARGATEDR